ncbi:resolvase domain-containing protein [Burkholderia aenigmatica]|uniref:Resolvase domain-containing protein n=1 Tax=Burkholderia aenigmatica TaxID=2015348 RepID=A0A6J5J1M2_9BURK|nr:resolvase domain-containing protein [Burkholderia aenigmatica]
MELDASLSLRDEGLSAYHQRHVRQGALGVFLRAAEDVQVPAGSVLIVEVLDRLSRAEPLQALAQIVNAGINVVTARDGREYNREHLKAQPMVIVKKRRLGAVRLTPSGAQPLHASTGQF